MSFHGSPLDSIRSQISRAMRDAERSHRVPFIKRKKPALSDEDRQRIDAFNASHGITGPKARPIGRDVRRDIALSNIRAKKKPITLPQITFGELSR